MMPPSNAWTGAEVVIDPSACPICLSEMCEGHDDDEREPPPSPPSPEPDGLPADELRDAVDVAAEGRAIAETGIKYVVDGLIPNYGMLGKVVAYAKVGKTTFGHALGAAVASGASFLDRDVQQARVLVIAAEDPPEYTAWLARHLSVPRGWMTFWRRPIQLSTAGLNAIGKTVERGNYGLVLISSWQSVIAGLVRDENDNAGAVAVVECVKQVARATGIPWMIDAHAGKGEDQSDGADPTKALRGASGAAGAADFLLSLRYADGSFSSRRRLSGKGRFVSLEPLLLDYDLATGRFTAHGSTKSTAVETTWRLILETGVLANWVSVVDIARAISPDGKVSSAARRRVREALADRPVDRNSQTRRGQTTTVYRLPKDDV
jgi:hypothetical protein